MTLVHFHLADAGGAWLGWQREPRAHEARHGRRCYPPAGRTDRQAYGGRGHSGGDALDDTVGVEGV